MRSVPNNSNSAPNITTIVSVMSACAGLGCLYLTTGVHAYIEKSGLKSGVYVKNSLIDSYAKCGSIVCAWKAFRCMSDKDLVSWTTMITGLASHGLATEALEVFSLMQQMGVMPDSTTFIAILSTCSHGGLVDEGVNVFELMEGYKLKPGLKHYGCMMDLFSRAGFIARAYELVTNMPMEPNLVILGALLSACRVCCHLELAELVVKKIERACEYYGGAHVLLSNIYATQHRWNDVVSVREATRGEEIKLQGVRAELD